MARQRLLSHTEMLFLRKSRVFLRRNLARHVETDFHLLHLQPYFVADHDGQLENVPMLMRLRDIPGFPAKLVQLPKAGKSARLHRVLDDLRCKLLRDSI